MTLRATGALAPTFTHTQGVSYDVRVQPTDTGNGDTATIPTGNYRMCLAPAATDFLRVMEAAINASLALDGSAVTLTLALSAAGIVTLTFSGPIDSAEFVGDVWRRLGLASTSPTPTVGDTVIVGVRPIWGLAILTAMEFGPWQPRQSGGVGRTTAGRVYAVAASLTSYQRDHAVTYQPNDPAYRASLGCEATALHPAPEYMGSLGSAATAREWSVLDVLYAARNAQCSLAVSNWAALRTSTTERYWVGYVDGEALLSPKLDALDQSWEAYASWVLGFSLPTADMSGTRA